MRPVLLVGAGTGEATCGILYLASYLRRHGIEAYVRLTDDDVTDAELKRSLGALMTHLKPRLVGISLKWFHHLARALRIAKALKAIDPEVEIAVGGNSASYFWKDLVAQGCIDHVVLGDGELPLLQLCRGDESPANVVSRPRSHKPQLGYVHGPTIADVYYSHFDDIFLSQLDLASFSGWVAPGKGCGENCLYCGGTRGMQAATFGRATPFLRPTDSVQRDHREIVPRTWQLRYDFAGSTAAFLEAGWAGADLSRHSTTYFLWGVPPERLAETLSKRFQRVYVVLDVGCFSQTQRLEQIRRGLLKPCPKDDELVRFIEAAQRFDNLELEISGIAGLPFATLQTLDEERRLIARVLELGCGVGYQRLQAQPGALVTEHPERFDMVTEAKSFAEFLEYFERLEPGLDDVPMVRFADAKLERAVQRTSDELERLIFDTTEAAAKVKVDGRTRLKNVSVASRQIALGAWLGSHRVPAKIAGEPVTVVRSIIGTGLACAPTVKRFADTTLQLGAEARALLDVLASFERPSRVDSVVAKHPGARAVIEYLVAGRFLERVS